MSMIKDFDLEVEQQQFDLKLLSHFEGMETSGRSGSC